MNNQVSKAFIEEAIKNFSESSPANSLKNAQNDKAFGTPLVGFSSGDDTLFEKFKEHVGPFHFTPVEVFRETFKDSHPNAEDLTVISWILPQTDKTKTDSRKEDFYPSERWARARIFGEEFNDVLRKYVADFLMSRGCRAVAPALSGIYAMKQSPKYGPASTWSERHVAFASGLGTFGLCDGLITPVGKAMRAGSVVAEIKIEPTPRPYTDHNEYCLFFSQGTCGKCMNRCPVGAITKDGKDKSICEKHLFPATSEYVKANFMFNGYGCGHCQTGVPCESGIPGRSDGSV